MKYDDLIEGDELAHNIHWAKVYIACQIDRAKVAVHRWQPKPMPEGWDGRS